MAVTANRQVNISTGQGTWGSTGTVVRKFHGVTEMSGQVIEKTQIVRALGWLGPSPISAEVSQTAEVSFDGVCVYEDMPTILNGFFTAISASTSAAAPYKYPYTAPVSSTQAIYHYTMEFGTSTTLGYRANGVVFNDLTVKGEAGDLWQYTVGAVARDIHVSSSGMSTAMTDKAVNAVRMADTTLYVDAFTATGATTAVNATLINFELGYKTGRHTKQFAGSLFPGDFGEGAHEPTLKLTAEFNASAKAYVDELLGSTGVAVKRAIKIRSSASSSTITAAIHFAGQLVDGVKLFDDRDGNMTVALNFSGVNSTAMANALLIDIENGSSSTT